MSEGIFIVFEGCEGVGKTTQLNTLAKTLEAHGRQVLVTKEPGGSKIGGHIRSILMEQSLDPFEELLLFIADRAIHVREVIKPALEHGDIVLCDRFSDSTIAYQAYGGGRNFDEIYDLDEKARMGLKPHFVIVLDMDPASGLRRVGKRAHPLTTFEQKNLYFHEKVRKGFLELARLSWTDHFVIDADQSIETVAQQVLDMVLRRFPSLGSHS